MEILDVTLEAVVSGFLVIAAAWAVWRSPTIFSLSALTVTSAFLFYFLSSAGCSGEEGNSTCAVFQQTAAAPQLRSNFV